MRSLSLLALVAVVGGTSFVAADASAQLRLNPYPVAEPEKNFDWQDDSTLRDDVTSLIVQPDPDALRAPAPLVSRVSPAVSAPMPRDVVVKTPPPVETFVERQAAQVASAPVPLRGERWAVNAGQDLQSVLEGWSRAAGVNMVWDFGGQNFVVLRSADITGAYEDAIRALFDQYVGRPARPVGTIYLPNADRKKTLVVSLVQ